MGYCYHTKMRCEKCNKETVHLYVNRTTVVGGGVWECARCRSVSQFNEDLADIVKAALNAGACIYEEHDLGKAEVAEEP